MFRPQEAGYRGIVMSLKVVVQMDPVERINIAGDSTFALMLEAQARGKPVIATTIGGLPEMVEDGATGFLAKPSDLASLTDCLRRLSVMDDAGVARMGALARERALTNFTRERYYRDMTAIYAELSPAVAAGLTPA